MNKDKIKISIYTWGYYPALVLLREEQDNENYENCKLIKEALDEVCKGREWYLSSKVDNETLSEVYDNIANQMNKPEIIHNNMAHYVEEFKKSLKL